MGKFRSSVLEKKMLGCDAAKQDHVIIGSNHHKKVKGVGKFSSYRLGEVLKKRYGDLVGREYNADTIAVQSSATERTTSTAKLVLNGLFAQPLSVQANYTVTSKPYELNLVNSYCPAYLEELNCQLNSNEAQFILKNNEQLLQSLRNYTGRRYESFKELLFLYHAFISEEALNLTLPSWSQEVYELLKYMAILQLKTENGNLLLKRLNGGRMLKKMIDNMQNAILATSEFKKMKMVLYSAHEFNIVNILSALNVFEDHFPKFNSAVIIELYHHPLNNKYYVKLFYIRDVFTEAEVLSIPSCSLLCDFKSFKNILEPIVPLNYTKECRSNILLD
ncbi:hypothetical protein FQA39_LY02238 [Lamprigera yunnana]|nr:hypothetical protein FQA39_LY02238 [Lamprigera yunnana]